jgi:ubiquitin-conjugating enzyme E2 variant
MAHFALDNYNLGQQSVDFQYHHDNPLAVTRRSFADIVDPVSKFTGPALGAMALIRPHWATGGALMLGLLNGLLVAPAAHMYSHLNAKQTNPVVRTMQKLGLMIKAKAHGKHHHAPYAGNYDVHTGISNKLFDRLGVYRKLEKVIFRTTGAVPNSWTEQGGDKVRAEAMGTSAAD